MFAEYVDILENPDSGCLIANVVSTLFSILHLSIYKSYSAKVTYILCHYLLLHQSRPYSVKITVT